MPEKSPKAHLGSFTVRPPSLSLKAQSVSRPRWKHQGSAYDGRGDVWQTLHEDVRARRGYGNSRHKRCFLRVINSRRVVLRTALHNLQSNTSSALNACRAQSSLRPMVLRFALQCESSYL
jgi:hypothetical protein